MTKVKMKRKPSDIKKMRWALITSVCLNLLFGGTIIAHAVSFKMHRPEKMMMKDLPEPIANKLNNDISVHVKRARFNFKRDKKERDRLIEDFRNGTASLEDIQRRARQLNQNRCQARQEMQEIMLFSIHERLTPEERETVLNSRMIGRLIK